jgi:hypothetical protein
MLGKGSYGQVTLAKLSGALVAVKRPCLGNTQDLQFEAELLSRARHPCVQNLYGLLTDAKGAVTGLVTELLADGNVAEALIRRSVDPAVSCNLLNSSARQADHGVGCHGGVQLAAQAAHCSKCDFKFASTGAAAYTVAF